MKFFENKVVKEIAEWVICFVIAYVIYLVINYFFGAISGVKQSSMYPTAKSGDKLLISRLVINPKPLKRGDIITFEAPYEDYSIKDKENIIATYPKLKGWNKFKYKVLGIGKISYVKRVIATEGEHVYINEEGSVYINNQKIDEPYLSADVKTTRTGNNYDIIIPKGCVFAMGDNRMASKDCRELGAIPIERVEGKVIIRIWPLNKIGRL